MASERGETSGMSEETLSLTHKTIRTIQSPSVLCDSHSVWACLML